MPLQKDKNIYAVDFTEGFSLTKYEYVVEYKDMYDENACWEKCIQHHGTLSRCMKEYHNMERSGLWELRVVKIAITETPLYVNKED